MTSQPRAPKPKPPDTRIADRLYDTMKANCGQPSPSFYPAVKRRLRELIGTVRDEAEVELVALTLLEKDCAEFSAGWSLNWGSYDRIRSGLEVPPRAWAYALWRYDLPDGKLRSSVDYWLGVWADALDENPPEEDVIYEAEQNLEKLRVTSTEVTF